MKIKNFRVSHLMNSSLNKFEIRHITVSYKDTSLCNINIKHRNKLQISLEYYSTLEYYIEVYNYYNIYCGNSRICMDCFNKLPKGILDKIKFDYIVSKLKNED